MLLVGLACSTARAGSSDTAAPGDAAPGNGAGPALALTRLFERTCFVHAGDPASLRAELAGAPYRPAPDEATRRMLARPGQAYRVPGGQGHLMVLSFDDGWCGDGGTGIGAHALTMQLSHAMQAHDVGMQLMGAGRDGREQRYLLTPKPPAPPIVLLVLLQPATTGAATTHDGSPDRTDTLMQANLFAAPMPPDGPEPPP